MTKDHIEEAISTERALDLALEALEYIENNYMSLPKSGSEAITAIKQARALDKKAENARELGLDYEPVERYTYGTPLLDAFTKPAPVQEPVAIVDEDGVIVVCNYKYKPGDKLYTTPPAAPVPEPVAFNAGVPPLYPEMKDGETISVEYTTPPGGRQSEDCLTAAQKDIQRLSALVRAQQITIDKLEQGEPVTERNVT
jgi:hypothetical protein